MLKNICTSNCNICDCTSRETVRNYGAGILTYIIYNLIYTYMYNIYLQVYTILVHIVRAGSSLSSPVMVIASSHAAIRVRP